MGFKHFSQLNDVAICIYNLVSNVTLTGGMQKLYYMRVPAAAPDYSAVYIVVLYIETMQVFGFLL